MKRATSVVAGVVLALLLAAGAAWWWWLRPAPAPQVGLPPQVSVAPAPAASAGPAVVEIPLPEPRVEAVPPEPKDLGTAVAELLGASTAKQWLRLDDFPRRFVATVDNLGRAHAPSMLWPVDPTPGRFSVTEIEGRRVVDPDNAERYGPFVRLFESVDSGAAVALYVQLLPRLQAAYEELGYPGRRFHTRLLNVIDHLLAAPPAPELIEVQLTEVRGPIPSERPWVRYEFVDPALESASAGHKLMVRVGAVQQRRLKAKLRELRAELVRRSTP
jgi:Protein of unknown function (DUF3014)